MPSAGTIIWHGRARRIGKDHACRVADGSERALNFLPRAAPHKTRSVTPMQKSGGTEKGEIGLMNSK